ncbi:hypothetical protein [Flavobacterium sp.]|uniref:hypothetical protein n=1 Tax=Flavobacterium sp. TaxID=239 RepID=UPI00374CECF6
MKYLSELTPAEIYILTKEKVTHRELLKITFIDLLLKQVLKTFEIERKPHSRDEIRVYKYVGIGQNFKSYNAENHENFFLSTFENDNTIEILFRNLVKIGYQNSRTLSNFKNELIKTSVLKKCFSQNVFQKLFNINSYTEYGTELKRKIEKEIESLNKERSSINNIENQKALELIKLIGGNIFMLNNINYELLSQIDQDLAQEMNKKHTDGGTGCSGCGFDNYSSSFDSGCSSGDSGSGCSSGCGGCGGCS